VSIEAKHLADGSTVRTSGVHPVGVGQWLSLTLISVAGEKRQVVKATLMVHGIKPSGHVTETLSGANGPDNIVKALTVPFRTDEQQNALANLWVPGVSAVDRIDLVSLDYSDGSTWIAGAQNCHVVPDPKMLIVNR
jgi:hypothetical protein